MSNLTPIYALPYPSPPDVDDVPADMGRLANAVDTVLAGRLERPTVGVFRNAPLTFTGTPGILPIPWDDEHHERNTPADSMHSTSVNPTRLVCPVAGLYLCTFQAAQQPIAGPPRETFAIIGFIPAATGAGVYLARQETASQQPNGAYAVQVSAQRWCQAGDYFECNVACQNPPQALSTASTNPGGTLCDAALSLLSR